MSKLLEQIIAKAKKSANWRLVGDIGQWREIKPVEFNKELSKLEAKYNEINLLFHCGGGSMIHGLQMYNRLNKSQSLINTDVEGLAASMAVPLFLVGKNRRMAHNAKVMIHQGSGGVQGSARQIKEAGENLEELNHDMAEIIAEAIQWKHPDRDAKWVKDNWMQEGVDTWFNAEKCKEEGLVHEVYKGDLKGSPKAEATFEEMVAWYDNSIITENREEEEPTARNTGSVTQGTQNQNHKMDKNEIIAFYAGLGITFSQEVVASNDDTFLANIKPTIMELKRKADLSDKLQAQLDNLAGSELKSKLQEAVKEGKIGESQVAHYEALAEQLGNEKVTSMIDELKASEIPLNRKPPAAPSGEGEGQLSKEREKWNYQAWEEQDPKGLIELADSHPDKYSALVEGYNPNEKSNFKPVS